MRNLLRTLGQKIAPVHSALVVVDVQNDMCSPDGSFARMGIDVSPMADVVPTIAELASAAKEAGVLTIYTQVIDSDLVAISDPYYEANLGFYELHNHGLDEDGLPTWDSRPWGERFFPPIGPHPEDPIIIKHRFGAFASTRLDQILRSNGIKTLILSGVLTDVCVESTARAAIDLDYYVVVVGDCTATLTSQRQEASLSIMGEIIATISSLQDVKEVWERFGRPQTDTAETGQPMER